ncbi:helix-turn-helix domain-containing protein [Aneurinibacillus aneurinilyticus]|jgi:DNA-binding MarR family transcriptional regulator|uniref:helix-turn-helix domain-containing protein n=1 Tax=Aneurinibacillus aneurinilyticus TaxID=1391 RepID=UPI0023F71DF0|nr:helix-turn-helix domain-containing protein [Aneurinibacillus aneurinilyticus]MCI1693291.1 helix-turn-helix domain-containing protein [Aneurinibacillus aneurinilyticus]
MAKKISSWEDKLLIYNLYKKGYTQKKIAALNDVSQGTISKIIKEMEYEKQIHDLKQIRNNQSERLLIE